MSLIIASLTGWLVFAAEAPHSVTIQEYLRKECEYGKQESCEKLDQLTAGLEVQQRLEKHSREFWKSVDTSKYMIDKKPNLQKVYEPVIRDFIAAQQSAGVDETLQENLLPMCSHHYHNHWINKKLWWPQNEDGTPDWPSIYEFIVDHYYGFCLKQLH